MTEPRYYVGTSGWSYPGWKGLFYPPGLPSSGWLEFYARHFATVEINMTFYRLPRPAVLEGWRERTPPGFLFTLKANRRITHLKRLRRAGEDIRGFYRLAESLGDKLGCILYQLPPSIVLDLELLAGFLEELPPGFRNVIEFRHASWFDPRVYELLASRRAAFCTVSSAQVPATLVETSGVAYFRFHGLAEGYRYDYSDPELAEWAAVIRGARAAERFAYFNNDFRAFAVKNGLTLGRLLGLHPLDTV